MPKEPREEAPTSTKTLIRAWQNINTIKRALIEQGKLDGDATIADTIARLREEIPPELLA